MTIRTRLTLWYSSLLATVIVVFGISLFSILSWVWHYQLTENMKYVTGQVIEMVSFDPATGQLTLSNSELPMYYNPYGIQVRDANQQVIAGDLKPDAYDPTMLDVKDQQTHEFYRGDQHILVMTTPIYSENRVFLGTIQIASGLGVIDATTERLLRVMISVGIVALLLAFAVGSIIAKQALQPIEVIGQAAKQITAADDLSKRIPYNGPPDELGQLTSTFNATLERLERLFNSQRRFVADVSHELRTPLTTIQGNMDIVRRYGNDPESLEAIDAEVKRMSRLVGDLLLLAAADAGRLPLIETNVELGTLALEVYRQAQVLAKDVDLRLGTVEAVVVFGDQDRLKQLLLNLVSNAIKYTPAGGQVVIEVLHRDGYAHLKVSDTGIGIPKEDLQQIFDRFYRVDKARSRAMGGTGLGLSIVQWIVESHNGKITAESEPGKGSTFTVQLPSLDAPPKAEPPAAGRDTRPRRGVSRLRRSRPFASADHNEKEQKPFHEQPVEP